MPLPRVTSRYLNSFHSVYVDMQYVFIQLIIDNIAIHIQYTDVYCMNIEIILTVLQRVLNLAADFQGCFHCLHSEPSHCCLQKGPWWQLIDRLLSSHPAFTVGCIISCVASGHKFLALWPLSTCLKCQNNPGITKQKNFRRATLAPNISIYRYHSFSQRSKNYLCHLRLPKRGSIPRTAECWADPVSHNQVVLHIRPCSR